MRQERAIGDQLPILLISQCKTRGLVHKHPTTAHQQFACALQSRAQQKQGICCIDILTKKKESVRFSKSTTKPIVATSVLSGHATCLKLSQPSSATSGNITAQRALPDAGFQLEKLHARASDEPARRHVK
jgi:hypothetical protein